MTEALPVNVLRYGREEDLPPVRELRAGPLTLLYEEGGLRYIRLGDREILRGVYVAVRDRNWGTIVPQLRDVRIDAGSDRFEVTFVAEHRRAGDGIDFAWRGRIAGNAAGTIAFTMDGAARSTFLSNRIGFSVLHPDRECAGQPCTVEHTDGAVEEGAFPRYIAPHQPFFDLRAIAHEVVPGVRAEVRFAGDAFEMEDQRNWTDASFKTYCTPLALPFPREVRAGTTIAQSVTLTLRGAIPAQPPATGEQAVAFTIDGGEACPLPAIGLGVASHDQPLSGQEIARLRALGLAHLRADLRLAEPGWPDALDRAAAEARALGVPLEIALFVSDDADAELRHLAAAVERLRPAVARWLVFHQTEAPTDPRWVALARERLAAHTPGAAFGSGTNAYFTDLNRARPAIEGLDCVAYSLNPQVHAFDDASIVETLATQAATAESARQFCGALPLAVGPITLRPRFNPTATGPEPPPAPGEPPFSVDPRQVSLLAAGWTTGSVNYLAGSAGGVGSLTYYETTGPRGVLETAAGSPWPGRFHSLPGAAFPLYHILADIGEFAGGEVLPARSGAPLRVDGLVLRRGGRRRVLLANLGPRPERVAIHGLLGPLRLRLLDETTARAAMEDPEAFRADTGTPAEAPVGGYELRLPPYAVARIDAEEGDG